MLRIVEYRAGCRGSALLAPQTVLRRCRPPTRRLPFLKPLTRQLDCQAFILSYRGYGASAGSPSELGLQLDACCAVEHVLRRPDLDPTRVLLFGRSLGGAVAAYAAGRYRAHVAGLVLENTFTGVRAWCGVCVGGVDG